MKLFFNISVCTNIEDKQIVDICPALASVALDPKFQCTHQSEAVLTGIPYSDNSYMNTIYM
jgi:hypothetical protein